MHIGHVMILQAQCTQWNCYFLMQLTLVELTDKLSKGTLQRPKHLDKSKNTTSDAQHEEPGIVLP